MKRCYDSPFRSTLKKLCFLLGLLLVLMLSITVHAHSLLQQGGYSRIRDIPAPSLKMPEIDVQTFLTGLKEEKEMIGGFGSDLVSILLVGQDRREEEQTARSDSMILCTYNRESKKLVMTSFLRDLYVPIPGHNGNRINAAYAIGGIELLEQTMEDNFRIHIDGGLEVDFSQFSDIIDLLGGVEIQLRQDEADYLNEELGSSLTEGTQMLSGEETLLYSRIRTLDRDGDFSRTQRQRKVLSALVEHFQNASFKELLALLEQVLPMISTDMSKLQLLTLAVELLPNLTSLKISSQSIPAPGTYTDEVIDGMAVLKADPEEIRKLLETTLLN